MADPYEVLHLSPTADDEAIRRQYLALVRQYAPEKHPEKFAEVRTAYESLRDVDTRLNRLLFEPNKSDILESLVEELECQTQRQTLSLSALLASRRRA